MVDEIVGEQLNASTPETAIHDQSPAGLHGEGAAAALGSQVFEPDNLPEMSLQLAEDRLSVEFCVEKIGTLLSTVDDLLMNIKIAEETLSVRRRDEISLGGEASG